jgi:hypothetical protein
MSSSKRTVRIILTSTALAVVAALALVAPASAAKPTWTITPGGAFKAAAKSFTLKDATAGLSLPCKASAGKGALKKGKGLPGAGAVTLSAVSASACSTEGVSITIKPAHLPWHLNLVSYNPKTGVTTGTLTGIHATMSVPAVGCSAAVDGTKPTAGNGQITVTYTNKTGKLVLLTSGSKLHLFNVKGCLGLVNNGDTMTMSAAYAVSPKQKITGA